MNSTGIDPRRFYPSTAQQLDATPRELQGYARQWLAVLKALRTPGMPVPQGFNVLPPRETWKVFARQADAFAYMDAQYDELHAFAFEDGSTSAGARKYLVTSYEAFWRQYKAMGADERHYYEVIRDDTPCRLYFDIEFALTPETAAVDGDELVRVFKQRLAEALAAQLDVRCEHIVDLSSTTSAKFSRHLIVHLHNAVFRNNAHAGIFVLNFLHATRQNVSFVDEGVYTRNRCFRLYRSRKYGKTAEMALAPGYVPPEPTSSLAFFRRTLVCAIGPQTDALRILTCEPLPGVAVRLPGAGPAQPSERSPYPAVDAFMLQQMSRGGVPAFVRSTVYFPEGKRIVYHVGGNRYCENVGRQHKSNHVYYIADLALGIYVQRCMDADCRQQGFESVPRPLPPEINPFIADLTISDDALLAAAAVADSEGMDMDELDDDTLAAIDLTNF